MRIHEASMVETIKRHKWRFLFQFIGLFSIAVAGLMALGLIPEEFLPQDDAAQAIDRSKDPKPGIGDDTDSVLVAPDEITRISIASVGIDVSIGHPRSQDVVVLDEALKRGAVYYPGSGTPASGNIFIFGHSTNWAIVQNQAYKAFNNLEDTEVGDEIILSSPQADFVYEVRTVRSAPDSEVQVRFDTATPMLTVSTCNTFGSKEDRHIVEAELVRVEPK
jgi:LPXTG-site transpeptidase (sortase) family protein